jgi:uncharacterized oligopeptide transporter (OPT) family protein
VLAAGNVYTGLKTGFIDGGGITAALVGFTLLSAWKRAGRPAYGALENNITQTTASSAAIMGFVMGLPGPIPALDLLGPHLPRWAIAVWGAAVGMVGIVAAALLRRKLIVEEALPFPTGGATAEVIETIYTARVTAVRRTRLLVGCALAAALVTWLRDGRPAIIPQTLALGGTLAGVAAATLTLGASASPLMLATGAMVGLRTAASMALGGGVAWAMLAPWLLRRHIVREAAFGSFSAWMVWPGLGLLIAGTFLPLLLDGGAVVRSLGDLASFAARRAPPAPGGQPAAPTAFRPRAASLLFGASALVIVAVGRAAFDLGPGTALAALALALVLAGVVGRATGETDIGPVGAIGLLTQLVFAARGTVVSVVAGWMATGSASQTAQTLWSFRAGQRLGASPRAQIGAQILGALVGAAVVVPVYAVIVRSYGLATEAMPAPSALSWKAAAEAARGGLAALPPAGPAAGAIALAAGAALVILGRTRVGRFCPSPAAVGMAMLIPASLSATALAGALAVVVARRLRPGIDEPAVMAAAAGGIAGEALTGVLVAALMAAGVL